MDDEAKRDIETQLALKEKKLALEERLHGLSAKKRRKQGAIVGSIVVFLLCLLAVCFGGRGIGGCGGDTSLLKWCVTNQCARADSSSTQTNSIVAMSKANDEGEYSSKTMALPNNSYGIVTPNDSTTVALHNGTSEKECPHTYLPIALLTLYGLFVFAGLGVAAYTVRIIAKRDDD